MTKPLKFFAAILGIVFIFIFSPACKSQTGLMEYVSELRENIYEGENDFYTLKACYGFKENPYAKTQTESDKIYTLDFTLKGKETDSISRSVSLTFNGKTYQSKFFLDPITDTVKAQVEIQDFSEKEFSADIISSTDKSTILMKSTLPENTVDKLTALKYLEKNQANLINAYITEDGVFDGKIHLKVIVKDQKPYWYAGITANDKNLKALLIDGFSGEVLAIREVL